MLTGYTPPLACAYSLMSLKDKTAPVWASPRGPLERHFAKSTKPDRDGPRRLGHKRGSVNPVEAPGEVHHRFRKQPAKEIDLLLLSGAAGMEVLPEGLVLDVVPAHPHTEAQTTAGQEINISRLTCDERRLALRKDQDPGSETDSLGDAGQIREHHERVVKRVVLGVGAGEIACSIGVDSAEHMVIGQEVVKAEVLHGSPNSSNRDRVSSKFGLWVDNADLHGASVCHGLDRTPPCC